MPIQDIWGEWCDYNKLARKAGVIGRHLSAGGLWYRVNSCTVVVVAFMEILKNCAFDVGRSVQVVIFGYYFFNPA